MTATDANTNTAPGAGAASPAPAAASAAPAAAAAPAPVAVPPSGQGDKATAPPAGTAAKSVPAGETTPAPAATTDNTTPTPAPGTDPGEDPDFSKSDLAGKLPPALRKELNQYFTQRTQKLSEAEKTLGQQAAFIAALQKEPVAVLKALAAQHGLHVTDMRPPDPETGARPSDQSTIAPELDGLRKVFAEALGDEQANGIIGHLDALIEKRAQEKVSPLLAERDAERTASARKAAETELSAFITAHPDVEQYADEFNAEVLRLLPAVQAGKLRSAELLERAYAYATRDSATARATQATLSKMVAAAAAAETAPAPVPTTAVTPAAPDKPTFDQAWEHAAAKLRSN